MNRSFVVAVALCLPACTTEFFVGADTDGAAGTETTSGATEDPSISEGESDPTVDATTQSDESTSTTAGTTEPDTTSGPSSQTTSGTTDTSAETTTSETTETSGETTADETTTGGELVCGRLEVGPCEKEPLCIWLSDEQLCETNPCETAAHDECVALGFEDCEAAAQCLYVGEPGMGDCVLDVCAPCELQSMAVCVQSPFCFWDEAEMFCFPA